MNNKRGGIGAKILLVLILMLLAAGGGAYGYRIMDGKLAVNDAQKFIKNVDVADYDTEEAAKMQVYIDNINKDLETAQSRKEVYELLDEFKEDTAQLKTKAEKELEAAKREAEEARNANNNNNNNNNNNGNNTNYNNGNSATDNTNNSNGSTDNGYKNNNLSNAEDGSEDGGLLGNLFGGGDNN